MALVLSAALCTGMAILLLLVLGRLLRRWLGAALAYQAWLLVPLVALASLLPGTPAPMLQSVQVLRPVQAFAAQATAPAPSGHEGALLLAWLGGMAAMALWFFLGHRAFVRRAGPLVAAGGVYVSAGGAGPASVGLLRPRIVVPHDFAAHYSPSEQALVIAHEQVHIDRGDARINLLAALFQCVFWFHPLVHLGARRLRQDQELACDARVMRRYPQQRRTYAAALLKSHTGAVAATGIHCHWQSPHPTKERIMSLQHTPPGTLRRLAGRSILALLAVAACGATLGVRAEGAASAPRYAVSLVLAEGRQAPAAIEVRANVFEGSSKQAMPRVVTPAGEQFSLGSGEWRLEMVVNPAATADKVWLDGKLFKGGALVTAPRLLARVGETATVRVGDGDTAFSVAMTVTPQP